ncbi:AMP-activated serine/threonine-protein kinase regulatory subunit [Tulasnella sp. JGI-2019a]|nr:AMP-activated serine/threonine-protein kinase regulatory subunit [Tulasnella sp. JGI-2019a]KAG9017893.1 AMP-activated serine/threonine-protein kinase regulatory subunit [Tulasnella sp. JGI-2019a]KAG9039084.1 AMP-activated serine/threonine-protein kinase regulatory subunit [Tulasnella sp. JGI-2019a]
MSTTTSPRVNRRVSARGRRRALSSLPAHQPVETHDNALQTIRAFLNSRSSYDVFPVSFRLIVLDNKLEVKKALSALMSNGVVSAPLWNAEESRFAGMFTVSDIIHLIQYYYDTSSFSEATTDVEHFQLESLRDVEKALGVEPPPLLHCHPLRPLYEACQLLIGTHARRLPLLDRDQQTGDEVLLSVLTQYRVLKFVAINCREISHLHLSLRHLRIGTYVQGPSADHPNNPFYPLKTATLETTVFDVVHMFSKEGISAVPIVDQDGTVINMYETVDVITLVRSGSYQSLDLTVGAALAQRSPDFPGVITCTPQDSLASLMLLLKQRRVHRLVVVEGGAESKGRDRGRGEWTDRDRSLVRGESTERSSRASPPTFSPGSAPAAAGMSGSTKSSKGRLVGIITLSDVLRYIVGTSSDDFSSSQSEGMGGRDSSDMGFSDLSSFPLRGDPSSRDRSRSGGGVQEDGQGSGLSTPGTDTATI